MLYLNGRYAAPAHEAEARFRSILWVDVNGTEPRANVLDIEQFDATAGMASTWVRDHVSFYGDGPDVLARLYCSLDKWPSVRLNVSTLSDKYRMHVRYHIANPTGIPHIVPGSDATQWGWFEKYDLSTYRPGYML